MRVPSEEVAQPFWARRATLSHATEQATRDAWPVDCFTLLAVRTHRLDHPYAVIPSYVRDNGKAPQIIDHVACAD
jgi:hypothetical protein